MSDLVKPNLEPIEEGDLNLGKKFGVVSENQKEVGVISQIEKESPKEILSAEKDSAYSKILTKVKSATNDSGVGSISDDAKNVYAKTDSESQIQHLVDLALQKGVIYSVKVARHMEDNYVLDMLHDRLLADELYDALEKKGLI